MLWSQGRPHSVVTWIGDYGPPICNEQQQLRLQGLVIIIFVKFQYFSKSFIEIVCFIINLKTWYSLQALEIICLL